MDEFSLIDMFVAKCRPAEVEVGIGDDAAVFRAGDELLVVSTDSMVEGIHFNLDYFSPAQVGSCLIEAAFSDVVAMGAKPYGCVVAISAVPARASILSEIYEGVSSSTERIGAHLLGGDLTKNQSGLVLNVTAIGKKSLGSKPCKRSDAKPGEKLYVSGPLGASMAGQICLEKEILGFDTFKARHLNQQCRIDIVDFLAEHAGAVIDVSDGLSSELHHIADASGVGLEVNFGLIPFDPKLGEFASVQDLSVHEIVLGSGEEYEILFTVSPTMREKIPGVCIGEIVAETGLFLVGDGERAELKKTGWSHF